MSVKFLSDDYLATATDALNANDDFVSSIANIDMGLQFHVTEGPEGDTDFYLTVGDGKATMLSGELDGADVSISSTHETAAALFSGELNTQMAFHDRQDQGCRQHGRPHDEPRCHQQMGSHSRRH